MIVRSLAAGALALAAMATSAQTNDARNTSYAREMTRVLGEWPTRHRLREPPVGLEITCIATPGDEAYVGIVKRTRIAAPLAVVESVMDDIDHYKDLFPGTVSVQVLSGALRTGRFVTAWEQQVPVFFMPNIRYVLSHMVDKSTAGVGIYRYRLERSDQLAESDGLVILESVGAQATQLTEYGFFLPRPTPVPAALIWREGVRGAFLSVAAIKHRSENPSWSYRQVAMEGERMVKLQADDVEHCVAQRNDSKVRLEHLLLDAR